MKIQALKMPIDHGTLMIKNTFKKRVKVRVVVRARVKARARAADPNLNHQTLVMRPSSKLETAVD